MPNISQTKEYKEGLKAAKAKVSCCTNPYKHIDPTEEQDGIQKYKDWLDGWIAGRVKNRETKRKLAQFEKDLESLGGF